MFQNRKRGSFTVEAVFVLPFFIFTVLLFIYFIKMVTIQENINGYLGEVARKASQYAHVYTDLVSSEEGEEQSESSNKSAAKEIAKGFITKQAYSVMFSDCADVDYLNRTWIKNGSKGIDFSFSKFMEEDETIDIIARYTIHIPFSMLGINDIDCVQRIRTRGFVGLSGIDENSQDANKDEKEDDCYVYITPNGTVYHKSKNCSHLKLNISKVAGESLSVLKNQSGSKYKPCEKCISGAYSLEGNYFYIAKQGNKYHSSLACSGLKRTVKKVLLSKVKGRKPCTKCGQ